MTSRGFRRPLHVPTGSPKLTRLFMSTTATAPARAQLPDPSTDDGVDELLSRPTPGAIASLKKLQGPFAVLGVGGKMGPTLARMIRRGLDEIGRKDPVYGVARFSDKSVAAKL